MSWSWTSAASLVIFVATYLCISTRRNRLLPLDRPSAALIGAVLMVCLGIVPFQEALRGSSGGGGVNWETILLLLGMMIVIVPLKKAGFFELVSTWILIRSKTPRKLLALLVGSAGLLSAVFVNDTVCVVFTPVVLAAVVRARLNPVPFLIALGTSANIGSVMTLTGNPQNMLVGVFSGIPYGTFLLILAPVAGVGLILNWAILRWIYRRELAVSFQAGDLELPQVDHSTILRILGIVALMTMGFLLPVDRWIPGLGPGQKLPLVAMAGAGLTLLVGRVRPVEIFPELDWGLLVFFSGLFIVVEGINRTGILPALHSWAAPLFGPRGGGLTLFTVGMSNLVSNVPFVLAVHKWISGTFEWTLIAMASTLAGNLTVVGSVANMIVLELSRDRAQIGFLEYLKAGLPVTLATTAAGFVLLNLFHGAGWL